MSLGDVRHQEHAQQAIQHALRSGRVPHAYLFHGPDGVGKEMLALGLAEVLLCGAPREVRVPDDKHSPAAAKPVLAGCGACEDCRLVAARTHPDLHLIYRQLNREHPDSQVRQRKALDLGIDVLRHFMIASVGLTPQRGRRKVFIVREADRTSDGAQNALLKTLEEPPGAAVIVLLATALDDLLPTTVSRCQAVRFDALPERFVHARLSAALPHLPPDQVKWYARVADGSAGTALRDVGDDLYGLNGRLIEDLARLDRLRPNQVDARWMEAAKGLAGRFQERDPDVSDSEATRSSLMTILRLASRWYADVLHTAAGDADAVVNVGCGGELRRAAAVGARTAADAIARIVTAERQLHLNANPQLCVETLLNDLARMACRPDTTAAAPR
ncbi:MAG: hypothetical protein HY763_00435 [Planctomycetes bacterium]|nr:hypothetical protein [Planctomycetota bacterium]